MSGIKEEVRRAIKEILIEEPEVFKSVFATEMYNHFATKEDIKELREDLKMIVEMFNKRFDDVNKRFDDVNKRFEMMLKFITIGFTILGILMVVLKIF